jgi:hypothetical protein
VSALQRAFRAALFDRKAHNQVLFDASATADAVLLVAAVGVAGLVLAMIRTTSFSLGFLPALLESVIGGLAQWLFLSLATWLAATKIFGGGADPQTVMRLHGHTYLPLLLTGFGTVPAVIGVVWFLGALTVATSVALNLANREAGLSVLIGYAIILLVGLAFRMPFTAVQGFI